MFEAFLIVFSIVFLYLDCCPANLFPAVRGIWFLLSGEFGSLNKKIILEPGRYLTAESGVLITKIIYIKENRSKKFLIVDAAMNDFIRPSLYGSIHNAIPLMENAKSKARENYDIVGPVCETGDFFIFPAMLCHSVATFQSDVERVSMAANFNFEGGKYDKR